LQHVCENGKSLVSKNRELYKSISLLAVCGSSLGAGMILQMRIRGISAPSSLWISYNRRKPAAVQGFFEQKHQPTNQEQGPCADPQS